MPQTLHPAKTFMYEYGCFAAFWSNFELLMEVAICEATGKSAKDNCKEINPKTAGIKKKILQDHLQSLGRQNVAEALEAVFSVADRNGWLHGHILNPNKDFSLLTRLRIEKNGDDLVVTNTPISFDTSPFQAFYEAYGHFEILSGISKERCNKYISEIQAK
jgi:hypothetical protein